MDRCHDWSVVVASKQDSYEGSKGGKLGPSQGESLLGHFPLSSDTPTMKMKAVDNRYNSYGSKYEACTRLSSVARGNIRLAQDYRESSDWSKIDRCVVYLCTHNYKVLQDRYTWFSISTVHIKRYRKGMRSIEAMTEVW